MFVERPGGRLFYHRVESEDAAAESIVFLHGIGARHEAWRAWLPVLQPRYHLLLIDLRGFGCSTGWNNVANWSFDDLSDDILAVADDAGLSTFHAVGESSGGTAVLNLMTRGLERIKSAVVLSTAHRGGQIEKIRAWAEDIEAKGIPWWSAQMMERRFTAHCLSQEEWDWFQGQQDQSDPEPLVRLGQALLETDLTPRLAQVTAPLMIIAPDHSPFVTAEIALEIYRHTATSDLAILPHSRHGIFFAKGRHCAELTAAFLERNGS